MEAHLCGHIDQSHCSTMSGDENGPITIIMSSDESWTKLKALKQSLEFISFTEPHERVKTKL